MNKMAGCESFKSMYKEFVNEIIKEFPNNEKAKDEKLAIYKYTGDHMKRFTKRIHTPDDHSKLITDKDDMLFSSECKLVKDIGLDEIWPDANDEVKQMIWQYLNTMNMMSTALSNIPPPMLKSIEALAEQLASNMEGMDMTNFNMADFDMSKLDIGSLIKGMQGTQETKDPSARKKHKRNKK